MAPRENSQLDDALADSFPASDPPSQTATTTVGTPCTADEKRAATPDPAAAAEDAETDAGAPRCEWLPAADTPERKPSRGND